MGLKERNFVNKLFELLNHSVRKTNFESYFKDNNKFIKLYLSCRDDISQLFFHNKVPKHRVIEHDRYKFRRLSDYRSNKELVVKKGVYKFEISKLLGDLNLVSKTKDTKKIPRWKTHPPVITMEGINSLTQHLLGSLVSCETVSSRLKRLEELLDHIIKHPSAKNFAVRKGVISTLLFIRRYTNDIPTHETIQKLFATLGYVDPPNSNGIRILSIDGGGMRGIAVIRMLQRIEEISGKRVCDLFDFICGVSTGAIITSCLIPPKSMSLCEIYDLYRELSTQVFSQSAFWGTSMLLWSGAYYDTSLWEKFLKDHVGDLTLLESAKYPQCPKIAIVSTVINQSKVAPFVFRNYGEPYNRSSEYLGSFRHTLFEAVRASAAAPTFFQEFKIGDLLHQDGGLVVNNPTAIALHEAKTLWPDEAISCVVSIGTGKYEPILTFEEAVDSAKSSSSWKQIFTKILESATDTEAVHRTVNELLPEDVYFRLNPHLSHIINMDEISEQKISALEKDTKMYCRRNDEKFHELAHKLNISRHPAKKLKDYINLKIKLLELT